ncbi:MAG TPA: 2-phospho-L-lactate transferase CofD family protein [Vicinamibacterales bacterium]|nr:2-phospho-L-lactate transferase CofD family protein [Vicinamibacterales bacterium]
MAQSHTSATPTARVVLFSGGRGSGVLSKQLLRDPRIQLTLAINGYDDGASTGEVRRFLGDALGPSDFRKNASRLALELSTCPPSLVELLDARLPDGLSPEDALATLRERVAGHAPVSERLEAFASELDRTGKPFDFNDCSIGNLVFAGSFLRCGRRFNAALDDYCALLSLPDGVIENVTDGTNAHLVAIGADGTILGSEEEIVGAAGHNRIRDIFLIAPPLSGDDRRHLSGADAAAALFARRAVTVGLNPRLAAKVAEADLIIYAPGTQHSSLFPSYLTPGLSDAIARNLRAIKLLITNIQADAEIAGSTAVDIIERARFYLQEKGTRPTPTPCLITHYFVNDPGTAEVDAPYVPLGQIETLEDPRLVRIANYEDGVTGRHDAGKILGPFIQSLLHRYETQRLAIFLHDADSPNKLVQTMVEMTRGGLADLPVAATVFYEGDTLDEPFVQSLPFAVRALRAGASTVDEQFREAVRDGRFDYVVLFESSGMYRGEDVVGLASSLTSGRLDAVWGSRRLSVRDIEESYRFRYRRQALLGWLSYVGSHVLSLSCLVLFGRYISDTLSAVRAVRAADAIDLEVPLLHKRANEHLLSRLLRRKADILETPVQFLPISPDRVKRTSVVEGLQALGALVSGRFTTVPPPRPVRPSDVSDERRTTPVPTR